MKPKLVVITTPNREYNVLFENFEGPFRHPDHKFEWTRDQFQSWVNFNIIDEYPDYEIKTFDGVGDGPQHIGHCTQIAVIIRKDFLTSAKNGEFDNIELVKADHLASMRAFAHKDDDSQCDLDHKYQRVSVFEYPYHRDTRCRAEKIRDTVKDVIYDILFSQDEYDGKGVWVALVDLLEYDEIKAMNTNEQEIYDALVKFDGDDGDYPMRQLEGGHWEVFEPYPEGWFDGMMSINN